MLSPTANGHALLRPTTELRNEATSYCFGFKRKTIIAAGIINLIGLMHSLVTLNAMAGGDMFHTSTYEPVSANI